eukprot:m.135055 g.135055  ORF g.135055 m.135055 type:complete len:830 (-) comp9524_c0_seq3:3349-5838(-)
MQRVTAIWAAMRSRVAAATWTLSPYFRVTSVHCRKCKSPMGFGKNVLLLRHVDTAGKLAWINLVAPLDTAVFPLNHEERGKRVVLLCTVCKDRVGNIIKLDDGPVGLLFAGSVALALTSFLTHKTHVLTAASWTDLSPNDIWITGVPQRVVQLPAAQTARQRPSTLFRTVDEAETDLRVSIAPLIERHRLLGDVEEDAEGANIAGGLDEIEGLGPTSYGAALIARELRTFRIRALSRAVGVLGRIAAISPAGIRASVDRAILRHAPVQCNAAAAIALTAIERLCAHGTVQPGDIFAAVRALTGMRVAPPGPDAVPAMLVAMLASLPKNYFAGLSSSDRDQLFDMIIRYLARTGQYGMVLPQAETLLTLGATPTVVPVLSLVRSCIALLQVDAALDLCLLTASDGRRPVTISPHVQRMITHFRAANPAGQGVKRLAKAQANLLQLLYTERPATISLDRVIAIYCNLPRATDVALLEPTVRFTMLCERKEVKELFQMLDEMPAGRAELAWWSIEPALMRCAVTIGADMIRAYDIIRRKRLAEGTPRKEAVATLMVQAAMSNDVAQVKALHAQLKNADGSYEPHYTIKYLWCLVHVGQHRAALSIFDQHFGPKGMLPNANAIRSRIRALVALDRTPEAIDAFLEAAPIIPMTQTLFLTLHPICLALLSRGDWAKAVQLLRMAAPYFDGTAPRGRTLLAARAHNEFFLDLHGHTEYTALAAVAACLQDIVRQMRAGPPNQRHLALQLVTGRGRNSRDGVIKVRPAVLRLLQAIQPPLHGTVLVHNDGVIYCSSKDMESWIARVPPDGFVLPATPPVADATVSGSLDDTGDMPT